MTLPTFLIIGAVKGATTWIRAQLEAQPKVFLPGPEPHYFSSEFYRGVSYYERCFAGALPGQLVGEKSADYLAHELAPKRAAELLPHARLVVQLRNPIDRAYSDYKMLYRRGTVSGPPERYLTELSSEFPRFLQDGLYARHIARWLDHYARDQLQILLFEEVTGRPSDALQSVCRHIGLNYDPSISIETGSANDSTARLLPLKLRTLLAPMKGVVRPLRGMRGFEAARGVLAQRVDYPPLRKETRDLLVDYYASDVARLSQISGRDLSHWLEPRKALA